MLDEPASLSEQFEAIKRDAYRPPMAKWLLAAARTEEDPVVKNAMEIMCDIVIADYVWDILDPLHTILLSAGMEPMANLAAAVALEAERFRKDASELLYDGSQLATSTAGDDAQH